MKHTLKLHQVWTDGDRSFTITKIDNKEVYAIYHASGREVFFVRLKKGKAKLASKWKIVDGYMIPPTKIIIPSRISYEN